MGGPPSTLSLLAVKGDDAPSLFLFDKSFECFSAILEEGFTKAFLEVEYESEVRGEFFTSNFFCEES